MHEWLDLTPRRLASAVLFVVLLVLATRTLSDTDLWWHLATGRLIVADGAVPHTDPFSFTMRGTHWVAHEWLSDVVLYLLYTAGGEQALVLLTSVLVALTFAVVYRLCPARPHLAVPATLLAAFCTITAWGPRPLVLTMLCAALTLLLLEIARRGNPRALWLLTPLMLVWANLHSGFVLGLAILGAMLCGEVAERLLERITHTGNSEPAYQIGQLAMASGAALVASVVNPNGVELLIYPFFTLTSKAMQTYIVEWHSPDFHDVRFVPFAAFLLLLIAASALSPRRPRFSELLMTIGLGYAALMSVRNIPLFVIAATPLLVRQAEAALEAFGARIGAPSPAPRGIGLVNWAALLLVVIGALPQVGAVLAESRNLQTAFPVTVANYLVAGNSQGAILNSYNLGGYLIWRMYPQRLVFIDGRADVYGDAFMDEYYEHIWRAKGDWRAYVDRFGIRTIVLEHEAALTAILKADSAWREAASDSIAIVFERRAP